MMQMMQLMMTMQTTLLGFLSRNLKGYRFWILIATVMAVIQVGSDLALVFPLKIILDKIVNHSDPIFLGGVISFFDQFGTTAGLRKGEVHTLLGVILFTMSLLVLLNLVNVIAIYIKNSIASVVGKNLAARLRIELFAQLQRLTLDWYNRQKKGDIVQRITSDIASIERFVTDGVIDILTGTFTIIGIIIILLFISIQFTLLFVVVIPVLVVIVYRYAKSTRDAVRKAVMAAGEVANVASEDVGAITLIKAFTLEGSESMRFTRYIWKDLMATVRAGELQAQLVPVLTAITALATAIIIGVGAYVVAGNTLTIWFLTIPKGAITVGTLTVFLGYLGRFYLPIRATDRLANIGANAFTGAERIQEVFDQAPEVLETRTLYAGPTRLKGAITFDNVIFGYTPENPILKGIDLHIPAGRKVGVVGLSGGGKSTLIKLIPRFYEIQQGTVRVDDMDNRSYPLTILRRNISLVLQESILFEGTIRENIALGRADASDEEIIAAAKKAYIHDVIMSMPNGYNTRVREQGMNFSGGQRQRLAIARAILLDAPILILDEPTASLDVQAESQVTRALDQLVINRTVLLISHRLATLGNVDEIIVLKDGRIAERGTFEELKHLGGVFSSLLEEQNRYNLDRASCQSIMRPPEMPFADDGEPTVVRERMQQMQQMRQVATSPKGRLVIEVDGKVIDQRQLDDSKPVLTIGRFPMNDIIVPSQSVSRMHAQLRWKDGTWIIEDTESLNGLMYRGQRIERLPLMDGDQINLAPNAAIQYAS